MLVYYRPDKPERPGPERPEPERPEPESQSRQLTWSKRHWLLLTFLCVYWLMVGLIHHGWADRLWIVLEPLECFLALPLFLASFGLIHHAILYAKEKRTWRSTMPLIALIGTVFVILMLPTKAAMVFRQEQSTLELINQQEENALGRNRTLRVNKYGITEGQSVKYYSEDYQQVVLCLQLKTNRNVGLVRSNTGELKDCYFAIAWARRINEHWFETSESLSLWFFQPEKALYYWIKKNPLYLGVG